MLGSAVMTTLGLSIAEQFGYDVVTNSNQDHETLISTTTNDIIDRLLGVKERPNALDQGAVANELGQLIITRTINLKAITIDDLKELHENSEDFRNFRQYLTSSATSIGPVADPEERYRSLKQHAAEIIEAWHTYQRRLPRKILDALIDVSDLQPSQLITSLTTGSATLTQLGVDKGILVTLATYGAFRIYEGYREQRAHPLRYLSQIAKKQDPETLFAYPLGL
jgi:hypothetical protein